ncbi:unnamed protein product [Brassica rapa]|uniref:RDR1/2-like PH-like domain-containing protein n=1 Tax=Brassica campestris TaxID=3711 RepID=A0A8D9LX77_BRACM|nr:unnamed protein product [Brassica rapa]
MRRNSSRDPPKSTHPIISNFYEWKDKTDSKDIDSMEHDVDGLLMYFGFLGSPEKLRYLFSVCGTLKGGPKIYEKQNQHVDDEYQKLNFSRDGFDEWIKTTDFTSCSLIG